jgi:hypothetical protein
MPAAGSVMVCPNCSNEIAVNLEKCPVCGHYAGALNVREAAQETEQRALETRYHDTQARADRAGSRHVLDLFDLAMRKTVAVINVDLRYLAAFLTNDNELYSNYSRAVGGQIRKPARPIDDKERLAVEGRLFGGYSREIRYAALSLDGRGLMSYGPYAMQLRDIALSDRATLLEENSYAFVSKHTVDLRRDLPAGHRAVWSNRHMLAVAKLGDRLTSGVAQRTFPAILLFSDGNRAHDQFIEVHIYGPFDNRAVEAITGSSRVKGRVEQAFVGIIKDILSASGRRWIES